MIIEMIIMKKITRDIFDVLNKIQVS